MAMGDPRGTPQCTGIRSVLLQRCQQPGLLDTHDWACSLLRSIPAEKARSPKCCGLVPALLFSRRKVFETSLAFSSRTSFDRKETPLGPITAVEEEEPTWENSIFKSFAFSPSWAPKFLSFNSRQQFQNKTNLSFANIKNFFNTLKKRKRSL